VARSETPDEPVMAVLLDGPAWARRRTVGDRDGLPVEVLSGMLRWPAVERVWLPTWLRDREAVLDRLAAAVAAVPAAAPALTAQRPAVPAGTAVVPPLPAPAEPPTPEVRAVVPLRAAPPAVLETVLPQPVPAPEPLPAAPAGTAAVEVATAPRAGRRATRKPAAPQLDGETAFSPWTPRGGLERKALDSLDDPRAARTVRRVLTAGLRAEGPVHRDRLVRIAAGAFGLSRVSEARRDALLRLLPDGVVDGDFAWPESLDRAGWAGFRRQAASADRPLEHVAPEEVGNAMAALCRAAGELAEDELFVRTTEVFGYRRRTPSLTPLLQAALTRALDSGRLVRQESGVLTAG
jgi:hypothetical protein